HPPEANQLAVEQDIAGPPVPVPRLLHHRLGPVQPVAGPHLLGAKELQRLGEDAGDVRVPLKAPAAHPGEQRLHLRHVEDVLVDEVAGGAVDEEQLAVAVLASKCQRRSTAAWSGTGTSSWARVQSTARSAAGLKPCGPSSTAPSWLPSSTTARSRHGHG